MGGKIKSKTCPDNPNISLCGELFYGLEKYLAGNPGTYKYWEKVAENLEVDRLAYAHDGFGCSPHAIGRSIRCTCLGDGEHTRWNRSDFIGVLQENLLPEWAKEKLNELTGQNVDQNMADMKME